MFLTLAALQSCQKNCRSHFGDSVSKNVSKIIPKIIKNKRKLRSGGCFGRSGSLPGAMLTRLGCRSAKMHARCCQSCPIWCQLGGQVGAKILKQIYKKLSDFCVLFWSSLGSEIGTEIAPKWKLKSTPRRFPGSLEAKMVKV